MPINFYTTSPPLPLKSLPPPEVKAPSKYSESFSSFTTKIKKPLGEKILNVVLAPLNFIVGLIQSLIFLIFLCVKGLFYKTGIKGYFIDNFILNKDGCTKKIQAKTKEALNLIGNGSLGRQLTIFDKNKNRIEAIVIEKEDVEANKLNRSTAPLKAISPKDRKWVVYDFGINSSNHHSLRKIFDIHKVFDANVICANSSGIGASTGLTSTFDELIMPTEAILRYLIDTLKVDKKNITLMGHSLGGAKAAEIASKDEFRGVDLILDRSFNKNLAETVSHIKLIAFPFNFIIKAFINWALPLNTKLAINKILSQGGKVITIAATKDPIIRLKSSAAKINHLNLEKIFVEFFLNKKTDNFSLETKLTGQHTLRHTPEVLLHICNVLKYSAT